ncbi:MAG: AgmX/PglI C-terminal domain-containing protein [Myxococcota bacterium]|nr:AgmX/PglI C-terminal domain-containing protein [Myxococcota bacterium]
MASSKQEAASGRLAGAPGGKAKVLRACVIHNGKVVDERRVSASESVSIGTNPKNTFALPSTNLPGRHVLFESKAGAYEVNLLEGMDAKLSMDDAASTLTLKSLVAEGIAQKTATGYTLSVSPRHRGKVQLGAITVIFQFISPPPDPPQPKLPASAQGSIGQQIDWPYATILSLSAILHFATVMVFENTPMPEAVSIDTMDNRWAELIVPEKPKDKPKPKPKKKKKKEQPKSEKKVAKAPAEKKAPKQEPKTEKEAKVRAEKKQAARKTISNRGMLALLGSKSGAGAAVADVLSAGGIGGDLDSAFDGVAGVGVAAAGSPTKRGGSAGEAASIGGLATMGGVKIGRQKKKTRRVASSAVGTIEADGSLDSDKIARVVRKYQKGVQACYEKALKRDSNLSGKLEVEITIGEDGKVIEVAILEDGLGSRSLQTCVRSRVRRWRFPKPDGGEVTFSFPFIFSSSG